MPRHSTATRRAALLPPAFALPAFALSALALPGTAAAAGYIALDGSSLTLGEAFADDPNPRGGRLRLGVRVSESFDLELQAGYAEERDTPSLDVLEIAWGAAYLKGYLPLGERSAAYALGGLAAIGITQRVGAGEFSDERGGFSFGVGLETGLTERLDLSADWTRYAGERGALEQVDAVSLGLKLYF